MCLRYRHVNIYVIDITPNLKSDMSEILRSMRYKESDISIVDCIYLYIYNYNYK